VAGKAPDVAAGGEAAALKGVAGTAAIDGAGGPPASGA
jgi:hypothetical protein